MARVRKKNVGLAVLTAIMFLAFVITIFVGVLCAKKEEEVAEKTIPTIKISLLNTTLDEIHENGKNVKYGGNKVEIFDNGITIFYDNVEFKGRGNFSWAIDKKSYRLKFNEKVNLLGLGEKRKWALVGNGIDDSLMRNDLAYFMADLLGGEYKMEGRFVELVVDDENLGVYYLIKTLEIDNLAMDLREPDGVLAEVDNVYCQEEEDFWVANNGDCITVKDIVTEDRRAEVMEDFMAGYNELLTAISARDFKKASKVVDMESFAKYFVFSEFVADPDAYVTSWYFYKDGSGDKIHAGPVWDFDAAFGNRSWGDWPEGFYAPDTSMARFEYTYDKKEQSERVCLYDKKKPLQDTVKVSWVMCDLLEMPEFRELAQGVYEREFKGREDEIIAHIYDVARELGRSAREDAKKWGKNDFDEEAAYLVWWVKERFKFFESFVGFGGAAAGANE